MAISAGYPRNDIEGSVRGAAANVADKANELAGRAGQQVDRAIENAEDAVRNLADQGRDAGQRVTEVAGNMRSAVDKSVREQPMATLAVAVAMGFVVGALWKS